jgi:uncharacterized delta-60 repeat protein
VVHRIVRVCLAVSALALAIPATALARPGDLDPSFNGIGKVSGGHEPLVGVGVQADGKTLALDESAVIRYAGDGSEDSSYGKKGVASLGAPAGYYSIDGSDIAVLADGTSLVVGDSTAKSGSAQVLVVEHFLANGNPDAAFGSGGLAVIAAPDQIDDARLAVQADGRIVIGAAVTKKVELARLTAGGIPDPTFGGGDPVQVTLGPANVFNDVAVAPDAKIVVAGSITPSGAKSDLAVARLNADGTPDPSFSGDGVASADVGGIETGAGVVVQPDGKPVVDGTTKFDCHGDDCDDAIAVARFAADGTLDATFGTGGETKLEPPDGIGSFTQSIALEPDGKIVVAGGSPDFLLGRLNPDGTPDSGFGEDGLVWTQFRGYYLVFGEAMALAPNGKIVIAGLIVFEEDYEEVALARYLGGAGAADLDGDGTGDADDDCPRTFSEDSTGCPRITRSIRLKFDHHKQQVTGKIVDVRQRSGESLSGYLPGAPRECIGAGGGPVALYERRNGPDKRVAVDRKPSDLEFDIHGAGDYYAKVKQTLLTTFSPDGPIEICGAAKSKPVAIGG